MEPLMPNEIFHIFNHANGFENIFVSENNYDFFLKQYQKYIFPIAKTYCYCLMPNHFHLLIKIRNEETLVKFFHAQTQNKFNGLVADLQGFKNLEGLQQRQISLQFGHFFNSYAKAFNKQQNRRGSLFIKNFKRKKVNNQTYLRNMVQYIHLNPVKHGFCTHPHEWNYTSYNSIIRNINTIVAADEVIKWFNNLENFINFHSKSLKAPDYF